MKILRITKSEKEAVVDRSFLAQKINKKIYCTKMDGPVPASISTKKNFTDKNVR